MKDFLKKYNYNIFSVILIIGIVYVLFFSKGIYIGQDYNGYIGSKSYIENFFIWNSDSFVFNHASLLIKHFPTFFWNHFFGFSLQLSSFLGFLSLYLLAYFGIIRFLSQFDLKNIYKNIFALWYLFSLYTFVKFSDGHFDFSQFYIFLPFTLYSLFSFLRTRKVLYLIFVVFSIVFLQNIFITPYLVFIEFLVFFGVFIYIIFLKRNYLLYFLIFGIITFIFSFSFLYEYIAYSFSLNQITDGSTGTKPLDYIQQLSGTYTSVWKSFVGLGYWPLSEGYWPSGYSGSYYFPTLYHFSVNIFYILLRFLFIFTLIFLVVFRKNKIGMYGLYIFLLSIFLQVIYFFLLKTGNIEIIEIILKILPFFREPVGKVEGLSYFAIFIMMIGLFSDKSLSRNIKSIIILKIIMLFFVNMYFYFTAFEKRYSTAYLDKNVYEYYENISKILEEKKIDVDKFIIFPNDKDSSSIVQGKSVYMGVDPMISVLPYEFFYKVGGVPYDLHIYKNIDDFKEGLLNRNINGILIRKHSPYLEDILGKSNWGVSNFNLRNGFAKEYKEGIVFEDENIVFLYFPKKTGKIFSDNIELKYSQISSVSYSINLFGLKNASQISFVQNFNSNWKLYLESFVDNYANSLDEKEKNINFIDGLKKLSQKTIFEDSHKMVYDYANSWEIDAEYIKNNFGKEFYKENEDGSIDVKLTLYFKPQSYFYLGLLVSGGIFMILISYLIFSFLRDRKNNKKLGNN